MKEFERKRAEKRGRLTIVGTFLDDLCQERSLTWDQLATLAEIDASTVSRVLQGVSSPRPETLRKICLALGITDQDEYDDVFLSYGLSTEDIAQHAAQRLQRRLQQKHSSTG